MQGHPQAPPGVPSRMVWHMVHVLAETSGQFCGVLFCGLVVVVVLTAFSLHIQFFDGNSGLLLRVWLRDRGGDGLIKLYTEPSNSAFIICPANRTTVRWSGLAHGSTLAMPGIPSTCFHPHVFAQTVLFLHDLSTWRS